MIGAYSSINASVVSLSPGGILKKLAVVMFDDKLMIRAMGLEPPTYVSSLSNMIN